ncbi:MAG: prolyl aminopeptidase [Magnetococcales bacterium]|nr:prolyl aminopeptidase [Magnetococcales bacterium]|tara:strand:- start:6204 stop:7142 length:939 start_codon:yes stop_codon:yes gene_type:complete
MKYPEIQPYKTAFLPRGQHKIYYELSGNPEGVPIVFLHGGPGSGTSAWQRQFFNPEKYQIILLDQRGCGQSIPHGCLAQNTTSDLVEDLHALKEQLGHQKWHVFGGSWGSTLALAYADQYPEDFLSVVVYGVFLCRERELFNMYEKGGVSSVVFADVFEDFANVLPTEQQGHIIQNYHRIFQTGEQKLKKKALQAWTKWELCISRLEVDEAALNAQMENADYVLSHSLIENHYFVNKGFIDGDAILKTIGQKTQDFPVHIVQGRYDMVCPFETAYQLHKAVPHSQLYVIGNAGHTAKEQRTTQKITEILDQL